MAYLQSPKGHREIEQRLAGTRLLLLTVKSLGEVQVPVPPMARQETFARLLRAAERQYEEALTAAGLRRSIALMISREALFDGKGGFK
jgi:restriction endonuclease S subunit